MRRADVPSPTSNSYGHATAIFIIILLRSPGALDLFRSCCVVCVCYMQKSVPLIAHHALKKRVVHNMHEKIGRREWEREREFATELCRGRPQTRMCTELWYSDRPEKTYPARDVPLLRIRAAETWTPQQKGTAERVSLSVAVWGR